MAKVLIIDNSDHATDHLRKLLTAEDHKVQTAASREIALKQLKKRGAHFHAVFLAASVGPKPEDRGPAILRHLRRLKATKKATVYGAVLPVKHSRADSPDGENGVWPERMIPDFELCEKAYLPDESEPVWDISSHILNDLLKIDLPSSR